MKSKMFLWLFLLIIFFTPVNAKEEKYKIVSGDLETVGSEICFDTECFYVIENDENNVKLLTKYNLYVGGYSSNNFEWYPYGDEATGMQDSNMRGYIANEDFDINGVTPFSSDEEKGTNYSDYKGSIVERYVNNYKNKLEKKGIIINKARLISVDELLNPETFACDYWIECGDKYPWIYSTSYWTGSSVDEDAILFLSSFLGGYGYDQNTLFGVRPVIEVPVGYFSEKGIFNGPVLKVSNSDGVISNDDNSVDVIFNDLEQDVKYQTTIYNNTDKALYVNDINLKNISEDFINARLDSKSSNMMVEPGGSSLITFYVRTLKEEGAGRNLNDNITINFRLSDKNLNPGTFSNIFEMLALIVILCGTIYFIKNNKSKKVKTLLFVGVVSILGINFVYADDFIDVSVSGKIKYLSQNNIVSSGTVLNGKVADYTNSKEVWAYYDKVKNVEVKSIIDKPKKYFKEFDLTENKTGRVVAYLIENGDKDIPYDLVIMSNGVVIANSDSSFMFSFPNTEKVDGLSNVDFRSATTMQGMFIGNKKLVSVDAKSLEMDNTTNTSFMFYNCKNIEHDMYDFQVDNVENTDYMIVQSLYNTVKYGASSDVEEVKNGRNITTGKYLKNDTKDDQFPIYYYRGDIKNNNVVFGGICWKIVRTTETGGTKLIYNGKVKNDGSCQMSSDEEISIGASDFNSPFVNLRSTGYMKSEKVYNNYESKSVHFEFDMDYKANTSYYYGDSYVFKDGVFYLQNTKYSSYNSLKQNGLSNYRYTCNNASGNSCAEITKVYGSASSIRNKVVTSNVEDLSEDNEYVILGKNYKLENNEYILTSVEKVSYYDYIDNYNDYINYYSCNDVKTSKCDDVFLVYATYSFSYLAKQVGIIKYGNDVIYKDGIYTLIDTIDVSSVKDDITNIRNKYHYTCGNYKGVCSEVAYIYKTYDDSYDTFTLTDGDTVDSIQYTIHEDNSVDSDVKIVIDEWYKNNMTFFTDYLEDTVWCNDRTFVSSGFNGKDEVAGLLNSSTEDRYSNYRIQLNCSNKYDRFTVDNKNGNGKLKYPVALLTVDELMLAGMNNKNDVNVYLRTNDYGFWTMSTVYWGGTGGFYGVRNFISNEDVDTQYLVRPSISLKNSLKYVTGNGTVNKPYIIE